MVCLNCLEKILHQNFADAYLLLPRRGIRFRESVNHPGKELPVKLSDALIDVLLRNHK